MALVNMDKMLKDALKNGYAIPAFNIHNLETIQAVIDACNDLNSPVILAATPSTVKYADKNYLISIIEKASEINSIPLTFHLDHHENIENIKDIIKELNPPKGRMDIIKYNDNNIIVDYAHTPDAVEKIIKEVSKIPHNKVITIVGCGGNRDKTKRPIMGAIATNYSDYVIFTSDNPRYEKPKKILKDITCKLDNKNYKIVIKRKKAIKNAIQMLSKNDILLLLGKGHEEYQIIKNKKMPFSDKNIVLKFIRR